MYATELHMLPFYTYMYPSANSNHVDSANRTVDSHITAKVAPPDLEVKKIQILQDHTNFLNRGRAEAVQSKQPIEMARIEAELDLIHARVALWHA